MPTVGRVALAVVYPNPRSVPRYFIGLRGLQTVLSPRWGWEREYGCLMCERVRFQIYRVPDITNRMYSSFMFEWFYLSLTPLLSRTLTRPVPGLTLNSMRRR